MDRYVNIIEYLPLVLQDVDEMKAINAVENEILIKEWMLADRQLDNQFVITTDTKGISRYEQMLKLRVADSDTLETRIFRVLARFQEQAPYTFLVLKNILDTLLGSGNYTCERDIVNKVLKVSIELTVKRQIDIIEETLERIIPTNMILDIKLRYNTHETLSQWRHVQFEGYTHEQLKEDSLNPPPYTP